MNSKKENQPVEINTRVNASSPYLNQKVIIRGWISNIRKLGGVTFFDLRDMHGIIQIVFHQNIESTNDILPTLKKEDVILVVGIFSKRKDINGNLFSGEIEIIANNIDLLSSAKLTPLIIADKTDALEELRLKYRYLDIRRPIITNNLIFRSKFINLIRNYFHKDGFVEIETPVITKPTIGGANEFKIISSNHKNKYYSLVQSPQIYKQLLMYGGIEKYFQIAKCFRDEDSRSDRQLEFTQLDIEFLWADEKKIKALIENLFLEIIPKINLEYLPNIKVPFQEITFKDAMENYGSDKPDLRFENKIIDLNKVFEKTNLNIFKNSDVRGLIFQQSIPSNFIKEIEVELKQQGSKGLAWTSFENRKIVDGSLKNLSQEEVENICNIAKLDKFTLFLQSDLKQNVLKFLGKIRIMIANFLNIIDPNDFKFLWVVDWPLFEIDLNSNKLQPAHNPFTMLKKSNEYSLEALDIKNKEVLSKLIGRNYDLVLNGSEIGGGSIRINDREIQEKILILLGFNDKEINEYFQWFLDAMEYGTPQHGGIALGLDRILAILLKQNSIRDVIAFPKATSGFDEMTGAPIEEIKTK